MPSFKPISISISPNVEKDDRMLALKLFFQPWKWKTGRAVSELEEVWKHFLDVKGAVSFNSGRSALYTLLRVFYVGEGDEVAVQAFTCSAAILPILWIGAKPIYIDIEENGFNMDPNDLESKITPRTKAVIVQHTFGNPAPMDRIMNIARGHHIPVIEDCAHSIDNMYNGKNLGTIGDAAFFSFGRDKVISSVYGGIAVTQSNKVAKRIQNFSAKLAYPSRYWICQQLWHPLFMALLLPLYYFFHIGKMFLVIFQKIGILSLAIANIERSGGQPKYFPKKLPNALADLALHQFRKLERFQKHRRMLSDMYDQSLQALRVKLPKRKENCVFLRYPIITPRAHELIQKARKKRLLLGDWYTQVIAPQSTDMDAFFYKNGSCPTAQRMAEQTLNLPLHMNISKQHARIIIDFLKNAYDVSGS